MIEIFILFKRFIYNIFIYIFFYRENCVQKKAPTKLIVSAFSFKVLARQCKPKMTDTADIQ